MTKNVAKAEEKIEDLAKEELIEVIKQLGADRIFNQPALQGLIRTAKANVLRRKAKEEFKKWKQSIDLMGAMPRGTREKYIARLQEFERGSRFYKKGSRLWKRADLLQYGPPKKERANAAK